MAKIIKIFPPAFFSILKEPMLVQKQTIHQRKALDLCFLETEGLKGVALSGGRHALSPRKHILLNFMAAQRVFDSLSSMTWSRPHDIALPFSFRLQIAKIKSFLLM
jgi:hypothetical protein